MKYKERSHSPTPFSSRDDFPAILKFGVIALRPKISILFRRHHVKSFRPYHELQEEVAHLRVLSSASFTRKVLRSLAAFSPDGRNHRRSHGSLKITPMRGSPPRPSSNDGVSVVTGPSRPTAMRSRAFFILVEPAEMPAAYSPSGSCETVEMDAPVHDLPLNQCD